MDHGRSIYRKRSLTAWKASRPNGSTPGPPSRTGRTWLTRRAPYSDRTAAVGGRTPSEPAVRHHTGGDGIRAPAASARRRPQARGGEYRRARMALGQECEASKHIRSPKLRRHRKCIPAFHKARHMHQGLREGTTPSVPKMLDVLGHARVQGSTFFGQNDSPRPGRPCLRQVTRCGD